MKTITSYQDKIPKVFIRIEAYTYPTWTMLKDAHCFFSFVDGLQSLQLQPCARCARAGNQAFK